MKLNRLILLTLTGAGALTGQAIAASDTKISGFLTTGVSYSDNEIPYLRGGVSGPT